MSTRKRLGVGFIGSGFITQFHIRSWVAVRDADILGIWSPNKENAASAAALTNTMNVGKARPYSSISRRWLPIRTLTASGYVVRIIVA